MRAAMGIIVADGGRDLLGASLELGQNKLLAVTSESSSGPIKAVLDSLCPAFFTH